MTATSTGTEPDGFAVLYVDDEEQALKYFRKGFKNEYPILTAPDVPQALAVLEKEHARVGVLLTDHRMPGHTGVELLGRVRHAWPDIVRILVTAYSDVGSAVDAVNTGSVYKYLTKPVDPTHLGQVLREAMALFVERRRRDAMLGEKADAVQQLIVADRVRTIAAVASGVSHHLRHAPGALGGYLEGLGADEMPVRIGGEVDLYELVQRAATEAAGGAIAIEVGPGAARLKVDREAAVRMLGNVLAEVARHGPPGARVTVTAQCPVPHGNTTGVRLLARGAGPAWSDGEVASFFTPFGGSPAAAGAAGSGLLESYRIARAHGGELLTHKAAPLGPGLELRLPLDPAAVRRGAA